MNSLQQQIFMVQEQVYDLTKVDRMNNEEHTEFFNLIGWELLNAEICHAKMLDVGEFMKQIQSLIDSNKSYKNNKIELKLLALRFYKHVNS